MSHIKHLYLIGIILGVVNGQLPSLDKTYLKFTVQDSATHQPIEYVSISVLSPNSDKILFGGLTDSSGRFKHLNTFFSPIDIKIEFIGYQSKLVKNVSARDKEENPIDVDLGKIYLTKKALQFDEINVAGNRPPIHVGIEKKTYSVGIGDKMAVRNTKDILKKLPSVDINMDGNITINGDPNIRILIDGKQLSATHTASYARLDLLNPQTIKQIDIITNPSVQFDPEGMGGIINIVLNNYQTEGTRISASASAGNYHQYSGTGMVSVQKGKFINSIFVNGESSFDSTESHRQYEWTYPNYILKSVQTKTSTAIPRNGSISHMFLYNISEKHKLFIDSFFSVFDHDSKESITHTVPVEYTMTSNDEKRGWNFDIVGTHEFSAVSRWLSVLTDISFSQSGDHQKDINDRISNGTGSDDHRHIFQDDATRIASFRSRVSKLMTPFGDIVGGVSWDHKTTQSELEYLHAPYGFDYGENILAGYFSIDRLKTHKIFSEIEIGFRAESYQSNASIYDIELPDSHQHADTTNVFVSLIDSTIATSPSEQSSFTLYPNLVLSQKLFNQKLTTFLHVNRRINRPKIDMLHPFPVNMIDEYHVRIGNPFLKPEIVNIFRLGVSYNQSKHLSLSVFYKNIENTIQYNDVDFVKIGDQYFEVFTLDNAGTGISLGKELSFSQRIFSSKFHALIHYHDWVTKTDGAIDDELNSTTSGAVTSLNLKYQINSTAHLSLNSKYYGASKIPSGTIDPFWVVDVEFSHNIFSKHFNFICSVSDVFNSQKLNITSQQSITNPTSGSSYTQHLVAEQTGIGREIKVGLSYTFGYQSGAPAMGAGKHRQNPPNQIDY